MIIGLSGKMQSGKDIVTEIIKWYTVFYKYKGLYKTSEIDDLVKDRINTYLEDKRKVCERSDFKTVKFADKLKDILCILINCSREDLESNEFKNKKLGQEWRKYCVESNFNIKYFSTFDEADKYCDNLRKTGEISIIEIIDLTPRKLLQLIGTECGRNIIHPNVWVNATLGSYKKDLIHYYNFDHNTDEHVIYDDPDFSKASVLYINSNSYTKEEAIDKFYDTFTQNWIISDVRFDNELNAIKEKDGIIIRVERFCYDSAEDYCVCHPNDEISKQGIQIVEEYSGNNTLFHEKMNKLALDNGYIPLKDQHESETNLDNYLFDFVIYNKDISDTIKQVKDILIYNNIIK